MQSTPINLSAFRIAKTLESARSGDEIFGALHYIPTDNLMDMLEMIEFILLKRAEKIMKE